jgi:hypothetical protein
LRRTARLYLDDLGPLLAVAVVAALAVLSITALLESRGSGPYPMLGGGYGIAISSNGVESHVQVYWAVFLAGLARLAILSWASATMVAMLLAQIRRGRHPRLADLGCGLRYWPAVLVANLVFYAVEGVVHLVGLIFFLQVVIGLPLTIAVLLLDVVLVFRIQEVVEGGNNGLAALLASYRRVRRAGFLRVLRPLVVGVLCILPILAMVVVVANFAGHQAAGNATAMLLGIVVEGPLVAVFTTVLYVAVTEADGPSDELVEVVADDPNITGVEP